MHKFTILSGENLSNAYTVRVNWPDSLHYRIFLKLALPQVIEIFSKANTEITNFSDIVFFKIDSHPTWRLFLGEILPPDTFKISVLAVNIIWHCTFRFSARTSIYKVWSSFKSWTYNYLLVLASPNSTSGLILIGYTLEDYWLVIVLV